MLAFIDIEGSSNIICEMSIIFTLDGEIIDMYHSSVQVPPVFQHKFHMESIFCHGVCLKTLQSSPSYNEAIDGMKKKLNHHRPSRVICNDDRDIRQLFMKHDICFPIQNFILKPWIERINTISHIKASQYKYNPSNPCKYTEFHPIPYQIPTNKFNNKSYIARKMSGSHCSLIDALEIYYEYYKVKYYSLY